MASDMDELRVQPPNPSSIAIHWMDALFRLDSVSAQGSVCNNYVACAHMHNAVSGIGRPATEVAGFRSELEQQTRKQAADERGWWYKRPSVSAR